MLLYQTIARKHVFLSHDQMEVAMILQNIWINMSNCFVLGWKNPAFIL